jgi:hypothetical protein
MLDDGRVFTGYNEIVCGEGGNEDVFYVIRLAVSCVSRDEGVVVAEVLFHRDGGRVNVSGRLFDVVVPEFPPPKTSSFHTDILDGTGIDGDTIRIDLTNVLKEHVEFPHLLVDEPIGPVLDLDSNGFVVVDVAYKGFTLILNKLASIAEGKPELIGVSFLLTDDYGICLGCPLLYRRLKCPDGSVDEVLEDVFGDTIVEVENDSVEGVVFSFTEDTLLDFELDSLFLGIDEVFSCVDVLFGEQDVLAIGSCHV